MKILFMHPNMPGQYKHLCRAFAQDPANQVVFITKPKDVNIPNVRKVEYKVPRDATSHTHRYLINAERGVLQGQEVWRVCKKLKMDEGFVPDVICAHPGWGDAMFAKDIYPDTPLLSFFEFYYQAIGADVGFDPNDPSSADDLARIRIKNTVNLHSLVSADWGITPTHWQLEVHPDEFKSKISVLHDGIDVDAIQPREDITVTLPTGQRLSREDEVITYVSRNFEPYRGFPTFMQAAEMILKRRPNAHIIAVGADGVSYGKQLAGGKTYRQFWTDKVQLPKDRIHFVGPLAYDAFIKVLQLSQAHIYLTYPFVLSWSMLEAMAAGALVIGSRTQPVMEVIDHGVNGLLTDFFNPEQLADRVDEVFDHKDRMADLRRAARNTVVARYALKDLLPLHMDLIRDVAARQTPPRTAEKIAKHHTTKIAA